MTVAVVVPTYMAGAYLAQTLASLEQQTLPPAEVVVVDDGSHPAVVLPRRSSLPLRLLRIPHSGISAARNAGVRATTAPLVHVCDHDDLVASRFYEVLTQAMADPAVSVAHGDCGFIDASGGRLAGRLPGLASPERLPAARALARLLRWNPIASVAAIFRRDLFETLGGFRDFDFVQDWDFWIRAAAQGAHFAFVPELVAWHRVHPAQQSNVARAKILRESLLVTACVRAPRRAALSGLRARTDLRRALAREEWHAGRPARGLLHAARAFPGAPLKTALWPLRRAR